MEVVLPVALLGLSEERFLNDCIAERRIRHWIFDKIATGGFYYHALNAGFTLLDLVNGFHAFNDHAEYGVAIGAKALGVVRAFWVKTGIVDYVNEKLGGSTVRIIGPSH